MSEQGRSGGRRFSSAQASPPSCDSSMHPDYSGQLYGDYPQYEMHRSQSDEVSYGSPFMSYSQDSMRKTESSTPQSASFAPFRGIPQASQHLNAHEHQDFGLNMDSPDQIMGLPEGPLDLSNIRASYSDPSFRNIDHFTRPRDDQPWQPLGARQGTQPQMFHSGSYQGTSGRPRAVMRPPSAMAEQHAYSESVSMSDVSHVDSAYHSQTHTAGPPTFPTYSSNQDGAIQLIQEAPTHEDSSFVSSSTPRPHGRRHSSASRQQRRPRSSAGVPLAPCPHCQRPPKNASDQKKHVYTHEKPFRCNVEGCARPSGFSTINDLERHKKGVHHLMPSVGSTDSYVCAECHPPGTMSEVKFWPRLDNFKAHILRKHKDSDLLNVVERSKRSGRPFDARTAVSDSAIDTSMVEDYGYQNPEFLSPQSAYSFSKHAIQKSEDLIAETGGGTDPVTDDIRSPFYNAVLGYRPPIVPFPAVQLHAPQVNAEQLYIASDTMGRKRRRIENELSPSALSQPVHVPRQTTSSLSVPCSQRGDAVRFKAPPRNAEGKFECPECSKPKNRECDLKKHMKRHTRPFGCTFAHCFKRFGSRSDWKRHEQSQHYVREMWRCPDCEKVVYDEDSFRRHMRTCRATALQNFDDHKLAALCEENKLGNDSHGRFWCGFCRKAIPQKPGEMKAWLIRLNHIGDHFDKDDVTIDDWFCVEDRSKKRYLQDTKKDGRKARGASPGVSEEEFWPDDNVIGSAVQMD